MLYVRFRLVDAEGERRRSNGRADSLAVFFQKRPVLLWAASVANAFVSAPAAERQGARAHVWRRRAHWCSLTVAYVRLTSSTRSESTIAAPSTRRLHALVDRSAMRIAEARRPACVLMACVPRVFAVLCSRAQAMEQQTLSVAKARTLLPSAQHRTAPIPTCSTRPSLCLQLVISAPAWKVRNSS
eukprot:6212388-Pleurochrysis_carterae.AAC.2